MAQAGIAQDIAETGYSLEENALLKAQFVFDLTGKSCFADDSGLEVEALDNLPGVYSARYAGLPVNTEKNIEKLLKSLAVVGNRKAQFRTVIALMMPGNKEIFEGIVKGKITEEKKGTNGFGYDPVFVPDGFTKTFAEMTDSEKNKISHRAMALDRLKKYLLEKIK